MLDGRFYSHLGLPSRTLEKNQKIKNNFSKATSFVRPQNHPAFYLGKNKKNFTLEKKDTQSAPLNPPKTGPPSGPPDSGHSLPGAVTRATLYFTSWQLRLLRWTRSALGLWENLRKAKAQQKKPPKSRGLGSNFRHSKIGWSRSGQLAGFWGGIKMKTLVFSQ